MYAHREADRIPIIDSPWGATIERWRKEEMPEGVTCLDRAWDAGYRFDCIGWPDDMGSTDSARFSGT